MDKKEKLFNITEIINLRHSIHKNAELAFKEYKTKETIKNYLTSKGIKASQIKNCAGTGMYIDINGSGPKRGKNKLISFRAEMDALKAKEKNNLPYKSKTKASHLCGHDGHISALIGGILKFLDNSPTSPQNKKIRLIFQPSEEKHGGAKKMVSEGVLEGVEEIWGLHNVPENPVGKILCKSGVLCSGLVFVKIRVKGKGGHSSLKRELVDPVFPGCKIVVKMEEFLGTLGETVNNQAIIGSLLKIKTSSALNIIPEECVLEGTVRYFDCKLKNDYFDYLKNVIEEIEKEFKVEISLDLESNLPIINDQGLVEQFKTIRSDLSENGLPKKFSEDFSEFSDKVKGCFFIYNIGNEKGGLHQTDYDFNDECLLPMSELWADIMVNRLDLNN